MKPSERIIEIARRDYGTDVHHKVDSTWVKPGHILEYLDTQHEQHSEPGRGGDGERADEPTIEEWDALEDRVSTERGQYDARVRSLASEAIRKLNAASALRTAGRKDSEPRGEPATFVCAECGTAIDPSNRYQFPRVEGWFHKQCGRIMWERTQAISKSESPAQPEPAGGESEETVVSAWYDKWFGVAGSFGALTARERIDVRSGYNDAIQAGVSWGNAELKEKLAVSEARAARVESESPSVKCNDCGEWLTLTDRNSKPDKSWYAQHHECNKWLARIEKAESARDEAERKVVNLNLRVQELRAGVDSMGRGGITREGRAREILTRDDEIKAIPDSLRPAPSAGENG